MKKLYITLLLSFLMMPAFAEIQQVIENFSKNDYNSGAQNWQVQQQKNGIMYFANMNSLIAYNGINWEKHEVPGCGNSLRALHIAPNGDIYVGGHNIFGVFRAGEKGISEFELLSDKLEAEDKNFSEIWFINSLGESVVFQSYEKLFLYENGKITVVNSRGMQMLYSAVAHNTLFVATKYDGVFTLSGNQLNPLPHAEELKNKTVCYISEWNNNLIFVTQYNGLYVYEPWDSLSKLETKCTDELIINQAFCAAIKEDKLAVGTVQNGLYVINLIGGDYKNINTKNGLQNNTVLSLTFDSNNDLWLGLNRGIDYINLNSPFKVLFDKNNNFGSGYSSLLVGETLYLGTNQGLFMTTYKGGDIGDIIKIEGTQGQVYDLKQVDKTVYCCHHNGLFEIVGNKARKVLNIEGIWTLERLQKNPNYILLGSYNGLLLMEKRNGVWTFSNLIEGFKESSRLFEQDENGDIWVSHGLLGVFRIKLSDDLSKADVKFYGKNEGFANNEHISVFEIDNKIIFAAEDGIYRYNENTDRMEPDIDLNESLLGKGQYFFFRRSNNRLWFLKEKSICYAERQNSGDYSTNPAKSFSIPEELLYEYFDLNVLDNSRLLVSNEEGFTLVDFNALDKVRMHDVYIRSIYSIKNGERIAQQYFKKVNTKDNSDIEINYNFNSLGFEYCSASYSDKKNNQTLYSTRLLGYESEWNEPTTETNKIYTDIPNGKYTFQVKTYNRNYESTISEISFTVLRPWYRTVWAYIGYALIFVLLLFIVNRYIKIKEKQLEKENQKLMEQQKETYEKEKIERERQLVEMRNSHLENELKTKSNELASSTMNVIRKNEILIDIKDELVKIQAEIPSSNHKKDNVANKLEKVIQSINENIEHDDDWMKFEKEFDTIHQNFIKRLSETYKGLTINDKKLCAYLKMNLVSKDIAPLMNISVRGVEIGRYRLRKKLNLDRDTNLTDFLQNF